MGWQHGAGARPHVDREWQCAERTNRLGLKINEWENEVDTERR